MTLLHRTAPPKIPPQWWLAAASYVTAFTSFGMGAAISPSPFVVLVAHRFGFGPRARYGGTRHGARRLRAVCRARLAREDSSAYHGLELASRVLESRGYSPDQVKLFAVELA
jgi:hypothetical protein